MGLTTEAIDSSSDDELFKLLGYERSRDHEWRSLTRNERMDANCRNYSRKSKRVRRNRPGSDFEK